MLEKEKRIKELEGIIEEGEGKMRELKIQLEAK